MYLLRMFQIIDTKRNSMQRYLFGFSMRNIVNIIFLKHILELFINAFTIYIAVLYEIIYSKTVCRLNIIVNAFILI